MKGIMAKKDNGYCILIGTVVHTQRPNDDIFEVTVEYEIGQQREKALTTIVFANQQPKEDGSNAYPVKWADMAFRMKMEPGSVIGCVVWFPGNRYDRCYGYKCLYRGILYLTEGENVTRQNVIGGCVTWMYDKVRQSGPNAGKKYLSMGVSIGRDRDGEWQSVVVNIYNDRVMEYAKRALAPYDGVKKNVWFRCGDPFTGIRGDGTEFLIFTAYDYTISGVRRPAGNQYQNTYAGGSYSAPRYQGGY